MLPPSSLRRTAGRALGTMILAAVACANLPAAAATLVPGFTEAPVASGLSLPTSMAFAPDGRLFVTLQGGALRVIKNDALLPAPFVTLTVDSSGERGLLGIAFDPNFASNQFVYLYYTVPGTTAHNRVSRFTANGDVVQPGTETILLELDNLSAATNHNGGSMNFGADGKLYIGVGENANGANSQTLANLLGKMLRINSDGTIPADNPFFATATGKNRAIWALGLRNPFTFGVQPGTGRVFIDDVGQSTWEEIDDGIAGANYGWPISEGNMNLAAGQTGPLYTYPHSGGPITGCAITGGAFYNPSTVQFPAAYVGKYFFSDLCSGWIKVFDPVSVTVADFATNVSSPVKMQVGPTGSLYYLYGAGGTGGVYRVDATSTFGVTGAASRKVHGGAGTFNLPLSLVTTNPSTEPRIAGAGGSHTIVITFNHPPISGAVAVTEGVAVAGGPTFSGNDMIVPLTGVANAQYVTVTVSSVNSNDGFSGGTGTVRFGVLRGDVNGSRSVTVADLGIVNAQLAKTVSAANYLDDISLSGTLTLADKGMANAVLTTSLPAP